MISAVIGGLAVRFMFCPFDRGDEAPLDYPECFGVQSTPLYRTTTAALIRLWDLGAVLEAPPFWLSSNPYFDRFF